mgnify:FL=1
MVLALTPVYTISVGDVEMVAIDYTDHLDSGETLTGTPTATLIDTGSLVISNVGLNAAAKTILGRTVAISCAVQFRVLSQASGATYTVRVSATTTSSPARTVVRDVRIKCD